MYYYMILISHGNVLIGFVKTSVNHLSKKKKKSKWLVPTQPWWSDWKVRKNRVKNSNLHARISKNIHTFRRKTLTKCLNGGNYNLFSSPVCEKLQHNVGQTFSEVAYILTLWIHLQFHDLFSKIPFFVYDKDILSIEITVYIY